MQTIPVWLGVGGFMSSKLDLSLSADHTEVHLKVLEQEGQPAVDVALSVEDITRLIQVLGQCRETMLEGKELPPIEGATFTPVTRTKWALQPEASTDGSVLAFQHPAFGPVGLVLPPADADRLMHGLHMHQQMRQQLAKPRGRLN
ncbi:MAG: hypothetical protein ABF931_06060 [Acetobacter pasteurianus]